MYFINGCINLFIEYSVEFKGCNLNIDADILIQFLF